MGKIIGIDLGTTMSAMAYVDEMGRPAMIPNHEGKPLTPSAVLIRGDERVVGEIAKRSAVARPDNVFQFIKRRMCDPDFVFVDENMKEHRPEELSALILKKLKQDAEQALGEEVTGAVITVPAYFADLERNRTRQAGKIAGLEVLDIINEPTAAAIAYGLEKTEVNRNILVYDLGGGTFDVTILKIIGPEELQVLTSRGDRFLGGADFDQDLSKFFSQQFKREHGVDMDKVGDKKTDQDFLDKAEIAKIGLSSDSQVDVFLTAAGKVLDLTVKRSEFETLINHHIENTKRLAEEALKDAELDWTKIDKVLLVGGSTRIPMVREMVGKLTGKAPETGINPDEIVAMGAAVHAASLGGVTVRNSLGRKLGKVKVRNVTAHALGVIVVDDADKQRNSTIIEKDTEIPAECTETGYTTIEDNQTSVRLEVIQGEDEDPGQCIKVGEAVLTGIPKMPKRTPKIDVTLGYDSSGIVRLYAKEQTSGSEIIAELSCPGLMSEAEIRQNMDRVGKLKVS